MSTCVLSVFIFRSIQVNLYLDNAPNTAYQINLRPYSLQGQHSFCENLLFRGYQISIETGKCLVEKVS